MFVSQPFTNFRDLKGFKYFCSRSLHSSSFGYSIPRLRGHRPMTVAFPHYRGLRYDLRSPNRFDSVVRAARARGPFPSPSQGKKLWNLYSTLLPNCQQWVKNPTKPKASWMVRWQEDDKVSRYTFLRKGDGGFANQELYPKCIPMPVRKFLPCRKKCQPYSLGIGNIPVARQYSIMLSFNPSHIIFHRNNLTVH